MNKTGTRNQAALEVILSNTRHLNYCLRSSQFFLHMGVKSRKTGISVLRKLKVVIKSGQNQHSGSSGEEPVDGGTYRIPNETGNVLVLKLKCPWVCILLFHCYYMYFHTSQTLQDKHGQRGNDLKERGQDMQPNQRRGGGEFKALMNEKYSHC